MPSLLTQHWFVSLDSLNSFFFLLLFFLHSLLHLLFDDPFLLQPSLLLFLLPPLLWFLELWLPPALVILKFHLSLLLSNPPHLVHPFNKLLVIRRWLQFTYPRSTQLLLLFLLFGLVRLGKIRKFFTILDKMINTGETLVYPVWICSLKLEWQSLTKLLTIDW